VFEGVTDRVNATAAFGNRAALKGRVSEEMRRAISAELNHLTEDERRVTEPVLHKFAHALFEEAVSEFGSTKLMIHQIETGDAAPIRKAPFMVPFALRQEMENQVQDLLGKVIIIRESDHPGLVQQYWFQRKVWVGNKNGVCFDFGALYAMTNFQSYPFSSGRSTNSCLHGS